MDFFLAVSTNCSFQDVVSLCKVITKVSTESKFTLLRLMRMVGTHTLSLTVDSKTVNSLVRLKNAPDETDL